MFERTERWSSARPPVRWPLFAVLTATLVGVTLLAGLLAQAGAAPVTALEASAGQSSTSTTVLTDTLVFLPIANVCRLQDVVLTGPAEPGTIGLTYTFTVAVTTSFTGPLTYTWQATGQEPVVHRGGLTDTLDLLWELTGHKAITVEVSNGGCSALARGGLDVTTRGMIVHERKTTDTAQHDLLLVHNLHPEVVFNLTNTPDLDEGGPAWSPDGNWIAFAAGELLGSRTIYKIDLTTRQVYTVTDGTTDDRWPAWSPDGTKIAFMRNQPGIPAGMYIPDIWVMDVDGGNQQQLTAWTYGDEHPAWSADGQTIAFVSDRDYAGRDLYLMDADGENERRLRLTADMDEVYPTWGPEGWIYYTYRLVEGKTELLYRMNPETTLYEKVFDDEYNRYIASFAPDGRCFSFYGIIEEAGGEDKEVWKWCDGYPAAVNLSDNDISDEYSAWSPAP